MFTGIVQGTAPVVSIKQKKNFRTHIIKMPTSLLEKLEVGASVAHNGVCLTVTKIEGDHISFDLMQETLRLTNLNFIHIGDKVNIERAMQMGTEIGGHILSGHISCMAKVVRLIESENNRQIWFEMPNKDRMKYILHKGFIAIDGISLTIGAVQDQQFCVHLIPETRQKTLIDQRKVGSFVNIEIDPQTQAIVDTVERYLHNKGH